MMYKSKAVLAILTAFVILIITACTPTIAPLVTEEVSKLQLLKTTMGDFQISSVRLVDEVHDSKAPDGNRFLLVGLAKPDSQKLIVGEFSLESFQAMMAESQNQIYISGKDGSQTFYSQMGGWVDDDFVIGFTVPIIDSYTLYWPNNDPIPLVIED